MQVSITLGGPCAAARQAWRAELQRLHRPVDHRLGGVDCGLGSGGHALPHHSRRLDAAAGGVA